MAAPSVLVSRSSPVEPDQAHAASTYVRLSVVAGVATVVLRRPPTNAITGPVIDELVRCLQAVADEPSVGAIVITGGIRNCFSSGGDLDALFSDPIRRGTEQELLGLFGRLQSAYREIEDYPKPTVAAINGVAIGAGLELALVCDFRVASELSYFALPELVHRIIPGLGGTQRLAPLIGLGRAKEMLMLGRRVRAEEALAWGLVQRLAPHKQTLEHAVALARELTRKPAEAFGTLKRTIHRGFRIGPDAALKQETYELVGLLRRRFAAMDREES